MVYKDLSVVYKDASANTMDNEDHPMYAQQDCKVTKINQYFQFLI